MRTRHAVAAAVAALAVAMTLTACGGSDPSPSTSTPESSMSSSTPDPADHAAVATADLARRLGVTDRQITVVSDEEVTWRSSALGCPEPGKVYGQTLVEGRRVVLEAGGREYAYHSGGTTTPFLCEDPQSPASTS